MKDIFFEVISIIAVALAGILGQKLRAYFNDKEIGEELWNKNYIVRIVVNAVEQIATHDKTIDKYDHAKRKATHMMQENGLKVTEDELDSLIEDAVLALKGEENG